ncbi:MAG: hypothetical protein LLG04_16610, partial [Parachlamydia sp.]|nr:hypothetical protein [Parachlamydia sp.]
LNTQSVLLRLQQCIKTAEVEKETARKQEPYTDSIFQENKPTPQTLLDKVSANIPINQPTYIYSIPPKLILNKITDKSLWYWSQKTLDLANEQAKWDPTAALYQIDHFLDSLPIPSTGFFEKTQMNQVQSSLHSLHNLLKLYTRIATSLPPSYDPIRQNRILCMLGHIYCLAIRCDQIQWDSNAQLHKHFIDLDCFSKAYKDPFLVFYRPEDLEKRKQLLKVFPIGDNYYANCLFSFTKELRIYYVDSKEKNYFLFLLDKEKNLNEKLEELAQKIKTDTGVESMEVCRLAAAISPALEKDFIDSPSVGHFILLRHSTFLAKVLMTIEGSSDNSEEVKEVYHKGKYGNLEITRYYANRKLTESTALNMHRPQIVANTQSHNISTSLSHEPAKILSESIQRQLNLSVLINTSCSPCLQPTKTIAYFQEHLTDLTNLWDPSTSIDTQALFDLLFFKFIVEQNAVSSPIFEEFPRNLALQRQCKDFLDHGINYFDKMQKDQQPNIIKCRLFFIRLGWRLKKIDPRFELPNLNDHINTWLSTKNLTAEERSAIHLHRLLYAPFCLTHGLTDQENNINDSILTDALASWFCYLQTPLSSDFVNPTLHRDAVELIYSWSELLQSRCTKNPAILTKILPICGLDPEPGQWGNSTYLVYKWNKSDSSYWTLNLLTGKIANELGLIQSGDGSSFIDNENYQRLFGKNLFSTQKLPNDIQLFRHPDYGQIRIIKKDSIIQRQWKNCWYQYIPPQLVSEIDVSIPFIADHSHWQSISSNPREVLFFPLNNPTQVVASIDSYGFHSSSHQILNSNRIPPQFQLFERIDCIHMLHNDQSQSIVLPRFCSQNGSQLIFAINNQRLEWKENPDFFVREHQSGLIGSIPNYLLLKSDNGQKKLLVPLKPLANTKSFSREVQLDIEDNHRTAEYRKDNNTNGLLSPQNNHYCFLEYNLENDQIIPLSIEGRLYYAYLLLAQKKYDDANNQLEQIGLHQLLSKMATDILQMIWELPNNNVDHSPQSAAIRIRAGNLFNNYLSSPSGACANLKPIDISDTMELCNKSHYVPSQFAAVKKEDCLTCAITSTFTDPPIIPIFTPFHLLQSDCLSPLAEIQISNINKFNWQTQSNKYLVTANSSALDIHEFFGFFYNEAKNTQSPKMRLALCAKLHGFYIPTNETNLPPTDSHHLLFQFIHFALLYPDKAPQLPNNNATPQDIDNWLYSFKETYSKFQNQPTSHNAVPLPSNPTTFQTTEVSLFPLPRYLGSAKNYPDHLNLPPLQESQLQPLHDLANFFTSFTPDADNLNP